MPQQVQPRQTTSPIFILASSSKTRLTLVRSIGLEPALVLSPDVDETELPKELPQHYCMRVAEKKFDAALELLNKSKLPPSWVASSNCDYKTLSERAVMLAADTTIACGRRMLHKSYDKSEIRKHLELLSGRRHRAYTAIVAGLIEGGELKAKRKKIIMSTLKFKRFQPAEIELLVESGQCEGMAGGYTLSGLANRYLQFIQGSHSNVLGLPLYETTQMLQSLGLK